MHTVRPGVRGKNKIMEQENHTLQDMKKVENEKCTLQDREYGEKTEKCGK